MDLEERIMELSRYGYACGQILGILLLDTIGEENPALIRCMQGLNGGIGGSGDICGCMAAGCCLLSWFTGKPGDTDYGIIASTYEKCMEILEARGLI